MIRFISNIFRRRKMRPIVIDLPHKLKKQFGSGNFYTAGQVTSSATHLNIPPGLMPAAYAVACTPEEFTKAEPDLSLSDYQAVRAEIARLFKLDEWQMNCQTLVAAFRTRENARGNPPSVRHDGG